MFYVHMMIEYGYKLLSLFNQNLSKNTINWL
jgi:hypothetical protein